jgi:uncharacterized protein (TIGR03435 family)
MEVHKMTESFLTRGSSKAAVAVVLAALATWPLLPTHASAQQNDPEKADSLLHSARFEVVSIRPDDPDGHQMRIMFSNGTLLVNGVTMKRLACLAYGTQDFQMDGGPSWFSSERFAIEAKTDSQLAGELSKLNDDERMAISRHMVQGILADRLKLKVRQDSREMSILGIVVDKNGPKIHEAKAGDTYPNGLKEGDGKGRAGMMRFSHGHLIGQGVKLDSLASILSEQLGQIVQNKTGLAGIYDFTLEWSPEADRPGGSRPPNGEGAVPISDENAGISVYTALKEQLGLRLEPQKNPIPVYVVEGVERPSEN